MAKVRYPGEVINASVVDALSDYGLVICYDVTNKVYRKGSPLSTWIVAGIARHSTKIPAGNPSVYTATANEPVGLDIDGVAEVAIVDDNAAIEWWDPISLDDNTGKCDKGAASDKAFIGFAQGTLAHDLGGHLPVLLAIPHTATA